MTKLRDKDAERRRLDGAGPDFSEALSRGLQVVGAFADARRPLSLADIARAVDLPKATVRRATLTLLHLGYLEAEGRLFRMTPQILRFAHAYLVSNMLSTVLQPACEAIARVTLQHCSAAVLDGSDVVMIARAVPAQALPFGAGIGFRLPALSSALGRVLLSAHSEESLQPLLDAVRADTPVTETDPSKLMAILRQVQAQGYAFVDQEAEHGFRSIAVPVFRFDGKIATALNIGGPVGQFRRDDAEAIYLPILRQAADDLRRQLV